MLNPADNILLSLPYVVDRLVYISYFKWIDVKRNSCLSRSYYLSRYLSVQLTAVYWWMKALYELYFSFFFFQTFLILGDCDGLRSRKIFPSLLRKYKNLLIPSLVSDNKSLIKEKTKSLLQCYTLHRLQIVFKRIVFLINVPWGQYIKRVFPLRQNDWFLSIQ